MQFRKERAQKREKSAKSHTEKKSCYNTAQKARRQHGTRKNIPGRKETVAGGFDSKEDYPSAVLSRVHLQGRSSPLRERVLVLRIRRLPAGKRKTVGGRHLWIPDQKPKAQKKTPLRTGAEEFRMKHAQNIKVTRGTSLDKRFHVGHYRQTIDRGFITAGRSP